MKLCIALDLANDKQILDFLSQLKGLDIWVKVGLRGFIRSGNKLLEDIKKIDENFKIFLDLKLYDIPNTTKDSALEIANLNVDMFNIHASIGRDAMQLVTSEIKKLKNPPLILAVTALTSFDDESFFEIYNARVEQKVIDFAKLSYECGVDGVVCSVWESAKIKQAISSNDFITLTPAIKLDSELKNDQKRVATLDMAKENLSDFIVIGRAIYQEPNPKEVVLNILEQIK